MLELYEQNRVPPSQTSEVEGSAGGGATPRAPARAAVANEEHATNNSSSQGGGATSKPGGALKRAVVDQSYLDNHSGGPPRNRYTEYGSTDMNSIPDHKGDGEIDDNQQQYEQESLSSHQGNMGEVQNVSTRYDSEGHVEEDHQERNPKESTTGELMDKYRHGRNLDPHKDGSSLGQSPQDAIIKKIDKDKVKAALEKRRKSRGGGDMTRKRDLMDEDDLIERELEDGIELAAESEKTKRDRKQNWSSKASNQPDHVKQSSRGQEFENVEEGEVASFDGDADRGGYRSPKSSSRKRKAGGSPPPDKAMDYSTAAASHHHNNHHDFQDDRNRMVGRVGPYAERDHKRHIQENHV